MKIVKPTMTNLTPKVATVQFLLVRHAVVEMVCGAVARSYTAPEEKGSYRKLISRRKTQVQFWPK